MRHRRTAVWLAGGLTFAAAALVVAGLVWPGSWAGRLLSGAGLNLKDEPTVFPAEHVTPAALPFQMESLDSEEAVTTVTFHGLLDGWCTVCGSDPAHPDETEYYAGTLRIEVGGRERAGYCIDLARTLETGDSYKASLLVPAGADLCPIYWLLDTYSHEQPGAGLNSREEGAAIQAAIWHLFSGFQPEWNPGCWCYKQAIYDRAIEMIEAARGQCTILPDRLSLAVLPEVVPVGEAASLVATLTDHTGKPLVARYVRFQTKIGELAQGIGGTDTQGQVITEIRSDTAGTGRVAAIAIGMFPFGVIVPVEASKQPVLIQIPTPYTLADTQVVTWVNYSPEVEIDSFSAALMGQAAQVRWRTTREVAVGGFNLYHRTDESNDWTRLNGDVIASRGAGGGEYEWVHAGIDPAAENFYLLEVASGAAGGQFGPVLAVHRVFVPFCTR